MKKILGFIILTLFVSLVPVHGTQAQELPDFVVKAVAQVSTYSQTPYEPENRTKQGSGVFVDHGGCLYTNSHVVMDLEAGEIEPNIVISVTEDRGKNPEFLVEGEVVFVEQALDLAYVCPKYETDIFTHFFERKKTSSFYDIPFGKNVWVMGYPGAGEGTITISPGNIVGFLDNPDISRWAGIPELDPEELQLYKTDALSGPGVSGGLLVDENLELVGIPFAGSVIPGAFIFVLSDDVYIEFERRLQIFLHEQDLVPSDCVYDNNSDYYLKAGLKFYDNQCELGFDEVMEAEVKQTWKAFCGTAISQQRLVPAIRRSKELGDLAKWSDNLTLICGEAQSNETNAPLSINEEVELSAGSFAYGKARLQSLEQEQKYALALKKEIDQNFPQLNIHEDDWSTIVNSYIYGGYSLVDINQAIILGGVTVHPRIPFEVWRGSEQYLSVR